MALDENQLAELARMLAEAQARSRPPAVVVPLPARPTPPPRQTATA
jgi:hypothetical protein